MRFSLFTTNRRPRTEVQGWQKHLSCGQKSTLSEATLSKRKGVRRTRVLANRGIHSPALMVFCISVLLFLMAGTPALASCHQDSAAKAAASCCVKMEQAICACNPTPQGNFDKSHAGLASRCGCQFDNAPKIPYRSVEATQTIVEFVALASAPLVLCSQTNAAPLTVDRRVATLRCFISSSSPPRAPPFKG